MVASNVDFKLDPRQAGGYIRPAQRNTYAIRGGVIDHPLAGVMELIGRAGDRDLLAKNLISGIQ